MNGTYVYPIDPDGLRCVVGITIHDFEIDKPDRDEEMLTFYYCRRCLVLITADGKITHDPREEWRLDNQKLRSASEIEVTA